jgi:hypothetical protein
MEVNELDPERRLRRRGRGDQGQQGQPGPQAPDVIDVGLSFGPSATADGLLQPYKVADWDTIPDTAKDCRRQLVGRLLRRALVRDEHGRRPESAEGLGGPPEARVQGQDRARR